MRAVWLTAFGPPEVLVLGEAPDPRAGRGQVVLEVEAVGIPFVDTQVRAGNSPRPGSGPELPIVPGNAVGGTVVALGEGVDGELMGSRVVATTGGSGAYAERVAVAADGLIAVPSELALPEAVSLLADGRTALALIRAAQLTPGQSVLLTAAGGGVGTLLVQLARNAGAGSVIAAAGDDQKLALARELGATRTVNYRRVGWADEVRAITEGGSVDVIFDGVGGSIGRAAFELTARGGRFLIFGLSSGYATEASLRDVLQRGLTVVGGAQVRSPADMRELSAEALSLAAAGELRPVIGQTFPLERAADAHAAIEARGTIGKTLLIADSTGSRAQIG
jgi:NADPH:quinone reductase